MFFTGIFLFLLGFEFWKDVGGIRLIGYGLVFVSLASVVWVGVVFGIWV